MNDQIKCDPSLEILYTSMHLHASIILYTSIHHCSKCILVCSPFLYRLDSKCSWSWYLQHQRNGFLESKIRFMSCCLQDKTEKQTNKQTPKSSSLFFYFFFQYYDFYLHINSSNKCISFLWFLWKVICRCYQFSFSL